MMGGMINGDLEVRGKITCNGFVAKPKWWPDYVFESTYHLLSLDSVRQFISINKHLPGMPSQADVINFGQDISMLQVIQQLKIEELTLYVLEKDNQLIQQKSQINDLFEAIDLLKSRISELEAASKKN